MDDDNYPTVQNPDGSESEHVGASTSVAAAGLASAREDRKPSNRYIGNNMLNTMSDRSVLGLAQKLQRAP